MPNLFKIVVVTVMLLFVLTGCSGGKFTDAKLEVPSIKVTSTSVTNEGKLLTSSASAQRKNPLGENKSPAVKWDAVEGANYYAGIVNHLNQVGGKSDNIVAYGYVEGTYTYGDQTAPDKETP